MSGATKTVYAPEPFDVGRVLHADIIFDGQKFTISTTGPIDPGLNLKMIFTNVTSPLCYLLIKYTVKTSCVLTHSF